ncbi:MAG: putative spermidine/putrescine transport system permease protein [Chloroflexota bacterium]|nr:putative spermidine/putrescine transport system permease protein [Chloroflexota bacterium]
MTAVTAQGAPSARPGRQRPPLAWLGLLPFLGFAALFLLIPTIYLIVGSLQDPKGQFTVQNYEDLTGGVQISAYLTSIEISLVTALAGGVFGFLMAYAVISGGLPRPLRSGLMTFSGVASNFAGVPLALAFTFTIGRTGLLTVLLKDGMGLNIYDHGFSLYTKLGLEIVYFYFQLPLMILIIAPAIDGLKKEWREASENMGASSAQFWRYVALPVLMPSLLGSMILLFGNAFGAQATAYQLTGGFINIVPILIGNQLTGDVLHNVGAGYALAMGMVAILALTLVAYSWLQRRSELWLR